MAVDEWLASTAEMPMLRIYQWQGEWGSIGYFGKIAAAQAAFPEINWVRRWTGGGTVDHRVDWTYTLVAPAGSRIVGMRGAESYRLIHSTLAEVLQAEGLNVRLSSGADQTGAALCFQNPVGHDLVDAAGRKMAGAGQRRTSGGLLHQGSVAAPCHGEDAARRAERFAMLLAEAWQIVELQPPQVWIEEKIHGRYGNASWTHRR